MVCTCRRFVVQLLAPREAVSTLGFAEELLRILEPGGSIWMAPGDVPCALARVAHITHRVGEYHPNRGWCARMVPEAT